MIEKYGSKEIDMIVKHLGNELAKRIRHKDSPIKNPLLLCVMDGGFIFASDLIRAISVKGVDPEIRFLKAHSYNEQVSGDVNIDYAPSNDLTGKDVIIIDTIIDTGKTVITVNDYCLAMGASSVMAVCLIERYIHIANMLRIEVLAGIMSNDEGFYVGYGLDNNGNQRGLPFIATL